MAQQKVNNEIRAAVSFVSNIVSRNDALPAHQVPAFSAALTKLMLERYADQWYPNEPHRGSGNRCIRVNFGVVDPIIVAAGQHVGLTRQKLVNILPPELTIWIDPQSVCYRTSDRLPLFTVYDSQNGFVESTPTEAGPTSPKVTSPYYSGLKIDRTTVNVNA